MNTIDTLTRSTPAQDARNGGTSAISQNNTGTVGSTGTAADLENEFLTLMLAQIQNQDPTNPLDSNEYVSQLATFTQVESLETMVQQQNSQMAMLENMAILQSASLVGKDAMVVSEKFAVGNTPGQQIEGKIYLNSAVSDLSVDIKDSSGQVVHTINLGIQEPGDVNYTIDAEAYGLTEGNYSLEVKAMQGEEQLQAQNFLEAPIEKVHFISAQGVMMAELGFGLGTVSVMDISEIS